MTLKTLALVLSLSACAGGAPLATGDDVAPAACATPAADPAPAAPPAAPDAAVAEVSGSSANAGGTPIRTGVGLWMADGFVRDMRAAGFPGKDSYGDDFEIGDTFEGFVSYGMDIVTLNQSGSLASSFDHAPVGGPTSLIVEGDPDAVGRPIASFTGNLLANFVYAGMTNAVETASGDTTIRESPGGRVHCELAGHRTLACAFRGVIRADFH